VPKPPKKQSAVSRAARITQLGFAVGFAGYLGGTLLSFRLVQVVGDAFDGLPRPIHIVIAGILVNLSVLVLVPALGYVLGLFFDGPRWSLAISMGCGAQAFPLAILWFTRMPEGPIALPPVISALVATLVGVVATVQTIRMGQDKTRQRAAARAAAQEPAKGPLSAIDFEAVKRAEAAASAGKPVAPAGEPVASAGEPIAPAGELVASAASASEPVASAQPSLEAQPQSPSLPTEEPALSPGDTRPQKSQG